MHAVMILLHFRNVIMLFEKRQAKLFHLIENVYEKDEEDAGIVEEQTDRIPRELTVHMFNIFCFCFAIVTYCLDFISDIVVALSHYNENRILPAIFILILSVIPSIVLNTVSYAWICDDNYANKSSKPSDEDVRSTSGNRNTRNESYLVHAIICLFQAGPLWWYYKAISYAIKFRRESDPYKQRKLFCRMVEAERDATLLRFFEAFLESAPQLLVQSYILSEYVWLRSIEGNCFHDLPKWGNLRTDTAALIIYNLFLIFIKYIFIFQLIWRTLTVMSRFIVIVTFLLGYHFSIVPALIFHYLISLGHVTALQSIDSGTSSTALEMGLLLINSAIHVFMPFNMAEGSTQWRYLIAYLIEAIEGVHYKLFKHVMLRNSTNGN
uniref:XK-related protein n=1 Tax=Heterorhabditis bacteriophora TaxID=37862 RepID=A0A1I7XN68_HETBA